jgi:2-keto-4-pentenoate hydratase/2-oxohepta-3-ene-1,7-dioic acid hydratase in catechol pathway
MRVARFLDDKGVVSYGIEGNGAITYATGCPFAGTLKDTGKKAVVVKLLAPVDCSTLYCIGLNYKKHADELGLPYPQNPIVFTKAASTVTGHGAEVVKPRITEKLDYEVELAVVIGKTCKDVSESDALNYVVGYTVANDLSTRDWQKQLELSGGQWTFSKNFDGFAPLGPVLVTADEMPNPNDVGLKTWVNGELKQDSRTSDFIFNIQKCISFLSIGNTLAAGTVILTGTPFGVAEGGKPPRFMQPGDVVVCEIEGIGKLENKIVADHSTVQAFFAPSKL